MTQIKFEEIKWEKDEEEEAEVVKLNVGDSIEGILLDKIESKKYECMCYKIKKHDDPVPKVVLSTTVLQKMMEAKEIGDLVRIVRIEDGTNQAGQKYSRWETYHASLPNVSSKDENENDKEDEEEDK